jgi:hypothetical protein
MHFWTNANPNGWDSNVGSLCLQEMKFKYEDLEIWQLSIELIKTIYKIVNKFPEDEKYGLTSQGKRAVVSIALNIAEGSGRHDTAFLNIYV